MPSDALRERRRSSTAERAQELVGGRIGIHVVRRDPAQGCLGRRLVLRIMEPPMDAFEQDS